MGRTADYNKMYYQQNKEDLKERNKLIQRTKYQDETERQKILERNRQRYSERKAAYIAFKHALT